MESQSQRILEFLEAGNSLTPLEGLRRFGTMRLGARIWDLKHLGHNIRMDLVKDGKKQYASYTLGKPLKFEEEVPIQAIKPSASMLRFILEE